MATIKSYTDLEQSRKLAEILPIESADMEYMFLKKDGSKVSSVPFVKDGFEEPECCYIFISCWSLAALLDCIPNGKVLFQEKETEEYRCIGSMGGDTAFYNNPVDACVEMIMKLKREGIL